MPGDRLLIDPTTTLQIASGITALDAQVDHSSAYLDYAASHVGHEALTSELRSRAEQLADEQQRLGVLLEEIATQLADMVAEFTHVDSALALQAPVPHPQGPGSPDAVDARARHGWQSMTGVYVDAD